VPDWQARVGDSEVEPVPVLRAAGRRADLIAGRNRGPRVPPELVGSQISACGRPEPRRLRTDGGVPCIKVQDVVRNSRADFRARNSRMS